MNEALKEQFIDVSLRFKKMNMCFPEASDIPLGELVVMGKISGSCICSENGVTVSEIHERLYFSKPAVSQILNSLEKKGCIHRSIDPEDRRRISVTATKQGEAMLQSSENRYDQMLEKVFQAYGEEKLQALLRELNQLVNIYENLVSMSELK